MQKIVQYCWEAQWRLDRSRRNGLPIELTHCAIKILEVHGYTCKIGLAVSRALQQHAVLDGRTLASPAIFVFLSYLAYSLYLNFIFWDIAQGKLKCAEYIKKTDRELWILKQEVHLYLRAFSKAMSHIESFKLWLMLRMNCVVFCCTRV